MLNRFLETFRVTTSGFSLQDLEGFPYEEYQRQLARYNEAERWYRGEALNDQPQAQTGKQADLYPMRLNPIKATVLKHAYTVFGEVENDGRPLIVTKMVAPQVEDDARRETWKKICQEAEETLNLLWWENNGRELMIRCAIMAQIYGGCVLKGTYVPWEGESDGGWRQIPVRIEAPNPKTFIGIPDAGDFFRLAEYWIVRQIEEDEAQRWGYQASSGEELWYNEHCTRDQVTVRINNQDISMTFRGEPYTLGGVNPFGMVPAVYIPHIRDIDFLGSNVFDHLKGYIKELNLRYGDYGDATNDDAHPIIAVRDVTGSPIIQKVTSWLEIVNLGQTVGISGNEKAPDMFEVRQQRASAAMRDLIDAIWQQYERDSFVPPVAYGEDEGSQRSGMTLAMRFWPLGSHASTERYFWTAGMDVFQPLLLSILRVKGLMGITQEHTRLRMKQVWAPLLPRDREADVQEWSQRAASQLGSPEHLIELAGDVEDVPGERERMLKWVEDYERAKIKAAHDFEMELQEAEAQSQAEIAKRQAQAQSEAAEAQAEASANKPGVPPRGRAKSRPTGGAE